jgi:squalene-hopene/tetraprenyl-beta-curcumene cyclase
MNRHTRTAFIFTIAALFTATIVGVRARAEDAAVPTWNAKAAAAALDARLDWWSTWPNAARDKDTFCVSCHTAGPYALGRPALSSLLGEKAPSAQQRKLYDNVVKRVTLWSEVAPWYPDQTRGLPKSSESRGTESVWDALVLATRDAQTGTLGADTRQALSHMWALQMQVGDFKGAWAWLNFHYEPWESPNSPYLGAALATMAVAAAPEGYASSDEAKSGMAKVKDYLGREFEKQNLYNKLMLLWASGKSEGLMSPAQREAVIAAALKLQQADGGWGFIGLGDWKRVDDTTIDPASDSLPTALATLALQEGGLTRTHAGVARGLTWLERHQDPSTGRWASSSVNKKRDPASDAGGFYSDAATAYAVLSLTHKP